MAPTFKNPKKKGGRGERQWERASLSSLHYKATLKKKQLIAHPSK
jgi:hypothetical protein